MVYLLHCIPAEEREEVLMAFETLDAAMCSGELWAEDSSPKDKGHLAWTRETGRPERRWSLALSGANFCEIRAEVVRGSAVPFDR